MECCRRAYKTRNRRSYSAKLGHTSILELLSPSVVFGGEGVSGFFFSASTPTHARTNTAAAWQKTPGVNEPAPVSMAVHLLS